MQYTKVYDKDRNFLGHLQNASYGYTLKRLPLHAAKITLPSDDPENALCQMGNEVEIYDGGRRVERFRIMTCPEAIYKDKGGYTTYNCEHVLNYLMDDTLFKYHEIGGTGYTTRQCIEYVLNRQETRRWVLGTCAFTYYFQYSLENETLLRAILSFPKLFTDDYIWTFDTSSFPWTLNLVPAEIVPSCEMRYSRNMHEIRKTVDFTECYTRIEPLGYGEGVNQLTIEEVNGGRHYIDADTESINRWGLRKYIWVDRRFEKAASLLNRAKAILRQVKNPYFSYKISAADIYPITGDPYDHFQEGKIVRVIDDEHNLRLSAHIEEISKADVIGKPGNITVTIANKSKDAASAISDLATKASVNELYSQGATNLFGLQFADNADATHPATFKVYIPPECVRINKMLLSWEAASFRAYETGAAAGGGQATTSRLSGNSSNTSDPSSKTTVSISSVATSGPSQMHTSNPVNAIGNLHQHTFEHYHLMDHSHDISHTHTVRLPEHTHTIDLPNHTHEMVYGIYEGAKASRVTIRVDGNTVPAASVTADDMDIVPWLSKDADGKITRGVKHTIEIVPNGLTRIEATLYAQVFVQSVGGGDY